MLEPGNYHGRLAKYGSAISENGKPYVHLDFTIGYQWQGNQWVPLQQEETRTVYLYVSDAAYPYTADKLRALEFNGRFDGDMDFGPGPKEKGVALVCEHTTYEGKLREKWQLPRADGGYEHTALSADVARQLAARWKAENGGQPAGVPPGPPAAAPAVPDGADIPF